MNFSDKFIKIYWGILLGLLTILCIWRLYVGAFLGFDIYLFIFWFILVLFPIISEISLFGVSIKKEIESFKHEVRTQFFEIKSSIQNTNHQTVNINAVTSKATEEEIKQKDKIINEKNKTSKRSLSIVKNTEEIKIGSSEKALEKHERHQFIEELVNKYLNDIYGDSYQTQIKIQDLNNLVNKVVVDGVVYNTQGKIGEIFEIKMLLSELSFSSFYFIIIRFIQKLIKLQVGVPLNIILVSEMMTFDNANILNKQIQQIIFSKNLGSTIPHIKSTFFLLKDDILSEVIL